MSYEIRDLRNFWRENSSGVVPFNRGRARRSFIIRAISWDSVSHPKIASK